MAEEHDVRHAIRAAAGDAGARLDAFLAGRLAPLSRTRIKTLIQAGLVSAGGDTISDPSHPVKPDQTFAIIVPHTQPAKPQSQDIPLEILYEDAQLIVVNKPAGMVVHPAPGNPDRTLVNALIAHCGESLSGIGGVRRPGIVHRLDKDTSGLMVAAKTDAAHAHLAAQFAARSIARAYTAVVWGVPRPRAGEIEGNIGRSRSNRKRMAVVDRGGKPALTRYRVVQTLGAAASVVECRLATGRTHQIRVHLASRGHPIIGDRLYGRAGGARLKRLSPRARAALAGFGRQALHAHLIGFEHPRTRELMEINKELTVDIKCLISNLE